MGVQQKCRKGRRQLQLLSTRSCEWAMQYYQLHTCLCPVLKQLCSAMHHLCEGQCICVKQHASNSLLSSQSCDNCIAIQGGRRYLHAACKCGTA